MEFKFFKKDIIFGRAKQEGDIFVAFCFGSNKEFRVTSIDGKCIFAIMVLSER